MTKHPAGPESKTAQRKARRRRKLKQAVLLVVLIVFAAGAGTLWWAANHRAIPGNGSAAVTTGDPEQPQRRWQPVIVGPCDAVDIGQERNGTHGVERCQYTAASGEQRQHWVEEPPGGFPKSDPAGPFPSQPCGNDGDRRYSPVGDRLQCTGGTWQVMA